MDLNSNSACVTAHVLDLGTGRPAEGIEVKLFRHNSGQLDRVAVAHTNKDGRLDDPLLSCESALAGRYTLTFAVENDFLDVVPVEFEISDTSRHHHVPLVVSPFGYSTYRGAPPHRAPDNNQRSIAYSSKASDKSAPLPGTLGPGLTVHVIDISRGAGAGGMNVDVISPSGISTKQLITNAEGRTSDWLVDPGNLENGSYEILFDFDSYFYGPDNQAGATSFFPCARVRFQVKDVSEHHHIPLLVAPWGYSCYRGS